MAISAIETINDDQYVDLLHDESVGVRFEDSKGQYQLEVITINKTQGLAYRALRLTHLPTGQVIADPWQQGRDMTSNARLIARLCHWGSY